MMSKAAPEFAGLENNLASPCGGKWVQITKLDFEERTVKLNDQPALVAPVPYF